MFTQMLAIGKFADRENLDYKPVNEPVNGVFYNSYGLKVNHSLANTVRRPFKIDVQGNTTYIMFDDDSKSDVCIYRIVEE